MEIKKYLEIVEFIEVLKNVFRHSYTSSGKKESVAEHCWRTAMMAYLITDEFPEANVEKLLKMCLIHDLGECFIGDIPSFDKTEADELIEQQTLYNWLQSLPPPYSKEMINLYDEYTSLSTIEAKICKAIDNLEALISHNQAPISTWIPIEYDLQLTYGNDKVAFSEYLKVLRKQVCNDSIEKINKNI